MQVKKGEGWVTVKYFGLFNLTTEYVVYACLQPDGEIFDVTELATCQGMLRSQAFRLQGADCCKVWLTFNPQQTQREKQQHRQQDRHARQQEHQARQEQSARDKANRKQGRKGRKRR